MHQGRGWAVAVCASATLAVASVAGAQEVRFAGFTNGCFGAVGAGTDCVPGSGDVFESLLVGGGVLRYLNSTFDETTAGGFLGLGGTAQTLVRNFNNLGSFVIDPAAAPIAPGEENLTDTRFVLRVTFTDPLGIVGGQSQTYGASIAGSVRRLATPGNPPAGGYFVDFDDNDPFVLATAGGPSFTLEVADLNVNPTAVAASVTANVTANVTAVPEPAPMALVAGGLLLLVGTTLRRRARA
jgi:hypothetical protein